MTTPNDDISNDQDCNEAAPSATTEVDAGGPQPVPRGRTGPVPGPQEGRTYQETLNPGGEFHSHLGWLPHDDVIGQPVGGWYTTSRGHVMLGIRPTLGDYVRLMPRGPQVIYAKDLGNIVSMADILPRRHGGRGGVRLGRADHGFAARRRTRGACPLLRDQRGGGEQGPVQRTFGDTRHLAP